MKKNLLTLCLLSLGLVSSRAALIYKDSFNYTNGPIIVTSTNGTAINGAPVNSTNWFHTGTATATDFFVNNQKAEISASGGTLNRAEDVHCNFTTGTNAVGIVYSSFTVNCTNLPPAVGTYFAHFVVAAANVFHARIFAQAPAGTLPNTWRLGIAGLSGTVNKMLPVDLATNVDYQVVVEWDPVTLFAGKIWVNPISSTDPDSGFTGDAVSAPTAPLGYGFRQASSFGNFFCTISNLAVATTFEEAQTNVWSTNAVLPIIVRSPSPTTNFIGDTVNLSGLAAGQGQSSLTYTWLKNGNTIVANNNGNSNVLSFPASSTTDSGNYQMVATTPLGLSATSSVAFLWATNAPIPPTILPTTNSTVTVYYHQNGSLSVSASGPPTITYQWYYTNTPASGGNISDPTQPTLNISDVFTNNGTVGAYYCVASNPYGSKTSGVFTVVASGPPQVSIAFLRTLVDPVNYVVTNSNLRWQATGTITTATNLTSGDTASYYIQDSSGCGINIFVTHGGGANVATQRYFAPQQGDVVSFVGWLSSFNSSLELEGDTNDLSTGWTIYSNNLAGIPPPKVIPFSITNNLALMETNIEASIVVLTNVYFGTNAGLLIASNANTTITVSNAAGDTFQLIFSIQDLDLTGQTLPSFAYMVAGPLSQNLGNAVTPRNQAYLLNLTRFSDIVTNPLSLNVASTGPNTRVLTWTAAPYTYSYTVQAAGSVTGPYTNVASGLRFTDFNGTYTDTSASAAKFYRLTMP